MNMRELEYPFDSKYIIRNKKKIRRLLLEDVNRTWLNLNIAILGGSTTSEIKNIIELFLLNQGIKASFYESGYNQYYQEAVFENEKLAAFKPDIIYIHTSNRNIMDFPSMSDDVNICI